MHPLSKALITSALMLPLLAGCNELGEALDSLNKKIDEWNDTKPPVLNRAALAKPVIEISGNTVTFDGKPLVFTRPMEEWTKVIGPDFREDPGGPKPDLRTWDKLGLRVFPGRQNVKVGEHLVSRQVNSVLAAVFELNDLPGREWVIPDKDRYSNVPMQKFAGTFVINGAVFNAKTSVKELNAQLKRAMRFESRNATLFTMLSPNRDDPTAISLRVETLPTSYTGLPHSFSINYLQQLD